jgi:type I restriction enzyme M protein
MYATRATLEEIEENEFNLNIPRYVDTFESEPKIDIKTTWARIEELKAELAEIRGKMDGYLTDPN